MKKILLISVATSSLLLANGTKPLKDVVVTAQKIEENIHDVPIAINVFNDISIEDKKIGDLVDISYFVPNFYLLNAADWGVGSSSMRGMYSSPDTSSSTVGLYIDGVPTTNSAAFEAILDDVERVEVLRGPQGALYGKNAEAGVINVITKKPDNNFGGKVGLEYGEDNKQKINLSLRTPVVEDKFYIGLNGQYYNKNGNMKNTFLNNRANDRRNYYGKIYLRATPTDSLELALIASKHIRDDGTMSQNSIQAPNPREFQSDINGFTKNKGDTYAFKINYDFDSFRLESTTSYVKYIQDSFGDYDYSPLRMFHSKLDIEQEDLSSELKLNGEIGGLKWLAGVFANKFDRLGGYKYISDNPQMASNIYSEVDGTSLGIFAHLNYALTDKLNLLGGIRYDRDKSDVDFPIFMYKDSISSSSVSPKMAIEYKWTPKIMTYASVAKGYKAGGFYLFANPNHSKKYENESLINYEAGIKTSFFDKRLMLNATAYYMDVSDMQVLSAVDAVSGYISNAAKAKSYGLEVDGDFIVNNNFSLFGSFGLNNAKFDEFSDFKGSYKDNHTPYSPRYTYSLGATYRGFGGVYASANIKGYGKMYLDNANAKEHKAYSVVDAKIGYEWDNFDVYLYANNLFDKNHDLVGYYENYVLVEPNSDREIGIKFAYRF